MGVTLRRHCVYIFICYRCCSSPRAGCRIGLSNVVWTVLQCQVVNVPRGSLLDIYAVTELEISSAFMVISVKGFWDLCVFMYLREMSC